MKLICKKKKIDKLFILFFVLILSLGFLTLIRPQKEMSLIENRNLNVFSVFNIKDFISGEFQDNLEKSLSDQFIGSQTIKKSMNKVINSINALNSDKVICNNNYVSVGNGFATFDCSDYLINFPEYKDLSSSDYLNYRISELNQVNNKYDTYYYIINRSFNIDFTNNVISTDLYKYLNKNLNNSKDIKQLEINSYDDYKKYFYKTDHHWNYSGSYQGYLDIMDMFGVNDVIKPIDKLTFNDTVFYGSTARTLSMWDVKEKFVAYKFNFSKHKEYIDGIEKKYGNYDNYFNNNYTSSTMNGYYGDFYGNDYGEVIFDFDNDKDNLLILSSSFSNAINTLIASHFNKTFVIDLRHYKDFDIDKYIEENDIDNILFIGDMKFFFDTNFELGVL